MKRIFAMININDGRWSHAHKEGYGGPQGKERWNNIYFKEAAINLTLLPPNTYGKLIVEFKDDKYHRELQGGKENPQLGKVGVRLAFQLDYGKWIAFSGSEIYSKPTEKYKNPRWFMGESDWFEIPHMSAIPSWDGAGLLWIQGMQEKGSECVVAMATLVLAVEEK